ncbi:MAG: type IV pilus assembly protein PilM [Planctomycetaceae bacterium]|jgi:type IV pilus assembly protein PilM|nr:type IV pilus assembly protein PilM [Planctomycetaceae bacterium]
MAKTSAVWGIDIGNSSLKALRCVPGSEPGKIEAVAFDFIEHSKILSQPGAETEPDKIIAETLQLFLSRNVIKGDKVAISVSGQNTISRFLKLPPVDPKKIPDIIRYEAKQWLPFDLDDVIWDFQPIVQPDSDVSDDPMSIPDTEIGMFAMKKENALKSIAPYSHCGVSIDYIQSSPLAIYNYATFDQLGIFGDNTPDPNDQSRLVILSIGTDATDVVITNGATIWIRSFPIGGNSFTKSLTKGLKLTFSKAEYLKRNAAAAQDAQTVFKAMRPVFNEMLTEVNRSLEYYQNLNRNVKFSKIVAIGNAMKLSGLRQYLTQQLGYEVVKLDKYNRLVGSDVIDAPQFRDNVPSFAVCYGLVLQSLGEAQLNTNLIPKEIIIDRIIRNKKPWALAGAAALLLGLTVQFASASRALETLSSDLYSKSEKTAKDVISYSSDLKSKLSKAKSDFNAIDSRGKNLTSNVEGRITWLELLRAVNQLLPVDKEEIAGKKADEVAQQNRIFISSIDAFPVADISAWFESVKDRYLPDDEEILEALGGTKNSNDGGSGAAKPDDATKETANKPADAANPTTPAEGETATATKPETTSVTPIIKIPTSLPERIKLIKGPPAVPGKIVQISGYHYHNPESASKMPGEQMGANYLRNAFIRKLKFGRVGLPPTLEKQYSGGDKKNSEQVMVTMRELGISYPTLLAIPKVVQTEIINPRVLLQIYIDERSKEPVRGGGGFGSGGGFGGGGSGGGSGRFGRETMNRSSDGRARGDLGNVNPFQTGSNIDVKTEEYLKAKAKEMQTSDKIALRRFDFVIQFAWVETPPKAREDAKTKKTETPVD